MSVPPCMTNPPGAHRWGTKGRRYNAPLLQDRCAGCHRLYGQLPIGEHFVDPGEYPWADAI